MDDALTIWTIFERPSDHPAHFVVRPIHVMRGGRSEVGAAILADSLEAARSLVPGHLERVGPAPQDDPVIVETWL